MATHGGGGPHKFFKIFLPGSFELSLSIPPKFVAGLGEWGRSCCRAKLRDNRRAGTGRPSSWDVDLRRDGDDRLSLTGRGWRAFVSDNAVSDGHLLVFERLHDLGGDCLDLAVELFDASGCLISSDDAPAACDLIAIDRREKAVADDGNSSNGCQCQDYGGNAAPAANAMAVAEQRRVIMTDDEAVVGDSKELSGNCRRRPEAAACTGGEIVLKKRTLSSPSGGGGSLSCSRGQQQQPQDGDETLCRRIERPYQLRFLDLGKSLCERLGWSSSRGVVLCVAGDKRRWQVSVKVTAKSGGMMCTGWTEFAQDNGLAISDACVFLPSPSAGTPHSHSHGDDELLQVHILRGATPAAALS